MITACPMSITYISQNIFGINVCAVHGILLHTQHIERQCALKLSPVVFTIASIIKYIVNRKECSVLLLVRHTRQLTIMSQH